MPRKAKPRRSNLTSHELIEAYLDEAIATGDAAVIQRALIIVARARRRLTGKANRRRDKTAG
jgi:DNA-binding phage protein